MSCGLQNYNSPGTRDFAPLRGILPLLILEPVHIFTLAVPSFTPVTLLKGLSVNALILELIVIFGRDSPENSRQK